MISELYLENFLFMRKSDLVFSKGLNVITGETGAGKSVLLEAVKLLLGKKARAGMVLPGYSTAKIQAQFKITGQSGLIAILEENGFLNEDDPDTLLISRTFKEEGSGKVLVNGILTTAAFLKQLGPNLMEIHGQNEHQTFLNPDTQRKFLDRTGGEKHNQLLDMVAAQYKEVRAIQKRYEEMEQSHQNSAQRIQELQEISQNLASLSLVDEEEEESLKSELKRLSHSEQIINSLQGAVSALTGDGEIPGASSMVFKSVDFLRKISNFDPRLERPFERLNELYYELNDLESEVTALSEEFDLNPDKIYEVQSRLTDISRACRKYNTDFKGLFQLNKDVNAELEELYEPDSSKEKIAKALKEAKSKFDDSLKKLSQSRAKLAAELESKVSAEMADLGFNASKFQIILDSISPNQFGAENIEFFVSLNPGSPGGPLRKIASGGELSRVALALKKVLARCDDLPTLLFDEIDTGIGGKTAEAVASSLRSLGKEKQVLLVTHLHQIAKEGDTHFTVTKNVDNLKTSVSIQKVADLYRVEEIARMLGQTDDKGLAFARNLLKKSMEAGNE